MAPVSRMRLRSFFFVVVLVLSGGNARAQHTEDPGAASDIASAPPVAKRLYRDLVCMCGGCQRLPLSECRCGYAKQERAKVLALLAGKDLSTPEKEEASYVVVRDAFMKEYGGQRVLTIPLPGGFNDLGTLVPVIVLTMAVALVIWLGRRWVKRGRRAALAAAAVPAGGPVAKTREQEDLEDKLDDELRDID
jgi:cytochrome c-type biogenesis protein CcmF